MLPEDILEYMLFHKWCCFVENMDLCAVFFVIFMWKVTMSETTDQQPEVSETTTDFPTYFIQIGRGLTSIPRGGPKIQCVNLAYNHIYNLPPFVFVENGFVEVNTIELRQNQIISVSHNAFRELKQLRILDMPGNNISYIDPSTFASNTNLEKLDLTNNRIRFRNRPFLDSPSLETLILSDNRIDQIYKFTFTRLPNLKNLVISSNVLFSIADGSFVATKQLAYLSIAHTRIYKLSEEMFQNGSYPKIIDVTNSPLANMFNPPLTRVKNDGVMALISIDKYF